MAPTFLSSITSEMEQLLVRIYLQRKKNKYIYLHNIQAEPFLTRCVTLSSWSSTVRLRNMYTNMPHVSPPSSLHGFGNLAREAFSVKEKHLLQCTYSKRKAVLNTGVEVQTRCSANALCWEVAPKTSVLIQKSQVHCKQRNYEIN